MTPPVTYTREDLEKFKFKVPSRVMMSHTDQEGIANNIRFFTYLELGRFEYFRNIGMTLATIKSQGTSMAMAESSCKYFSPLYFDDNIEIYVRIDYMGDSSFHMKYLIFVPEREIVAAQGHTVTVFLDPHTKKAKLMPRQFKEKVLAFEGDGTVKLK